MFGERRLIAGRNFLEKVFSPHPSSKTLGMWGGEEMRKNIWGRDNLVVTNNLEKARSVFEHPSVHD